MAAMNTTFLDLSLSAPVDVEVADGKVVAGGSRGSHAGNHAHGGTTAPDAALAPVPGAVPVRERSRPARPIRVRWDGPVPPTQCGHAPPRTVASHNIDAIALA